MDVLNGAVERITYYNSENGYSVVRLRPSERKTPGQSRDGLVTVVGNLPELSPGEHLRLEGRWTNHPKHGMQFQAEMCHQTMPATLAGIRRYMGSGLIKGIGPRLAERIVDHFGLETLDVMEQHPERLKDVPDIGPKRSRMIAAAWEEQKQIKEIMLFLHGHGVTTNLAIKIYKQYGDEALDMVQSDPYRLAQDIYGVGFKTADRIAQKLGLPFDHPSRIEAGLVYALNEMTGEGHVFSPAGRADRAGRGSAGGGSRNDCPGPGAAAEAGRIRRDASALCKGAPPGEPGQRVAEPAGLYGQTAVYLTPLYYGETGVASRLRALADALPSRLSDLPPAFIAVDPQLSPSRNPPFDRPSATRSAF